jgi:hypothetical protein
MSTAECLTRATERVLQAKEFIVGQGVSRVVFVGSAIALLAYAAISFFKAGDDQEGNSRQKLEGNRDKSRENLGKKAKKKFIPERKFFTEEDFFSEDISTSNPHDRQSSTAGSKRKACRFMSESDVPESRSIESRDIDNRVKEEADDLYFALLSKLKD